MQCASLSLGVLGVPVRQATHATFFAPCIMITAKLTSCQVKLVEPYVRETPLASLHIDFLCCLNYAQRASMEHVVLSQRVYDVKFASSVGKYIAANSHPLRVALRGEFSPSARDLGVFEAASLAKCEKSCALYCCEADDRATEQQQCHTTLEFLRQLTTLQHKGIAVIEISHLTSASSLMMVALCTAVCHKVRAVHTAADDRCYLVGMWSPSDKKSMVLPDLSLLPGLSHMMIEDNTSVGQLEADLLQWMGSVYTWKCNTLRTLIRKVDDANSYSRVVNKQTQPWFDNFIDDAFPAAK